MAIYKSNPKKIQRSAENLFDTERERSGKLVFGTKSSPVPMKMELLIKPLGADFSEVTSQIDVEIPAMLRPLVGPQLQKAADKFGELIAGLSRQ